MERTHDDPTLAARASRLSSIGLSVQGGLALGALGVALATGSFAALAAAAHLGAGAGAWAAGAFVAGRRRRVADERAEGERLARVAEAEGRRPLFDREGKGAGSDQRAGAILAVLLATLEIALGVALVASGLARPANEPLARVLGGGAVLAGSAFALLLLAKYTVALATGTAASPLAVVLAGGRRAASGALVAFVTAIALAVSELSPSLALDRIGYVVAGLEVALGLELALALLLELYRPRRRGNVPRPAFESRLLALVAEPGGIARSLARAIDYQFGFQLSETWVYRLVERGLAPLAIFAAASLWGLSCVVVVQQHERGILERFGKRVGDPLEPGLHWKLPWPIESVDAFDTSRVREVVLGPDEDDEDERDQPRRRTISHASSHAEFFILVARETNAAASGEAPVDILEARIPVHFVVSDPVAYFQSSVAPDRLLKALGESELAKLGCASSAFALLAEKSAEAVAELEKRIQATADAHGLGIKVLDVNIADFHPPVEVQKAFRAETAALEDREGERLKQLAYAARLRPDAEGRARAEVEQARSLASRKKLLATADAGRFGALRALDHAAPHAFRVHRLLEGLEDALSGPQRRVILARGKGGSVDLDLGEKISMDDTGLGEGK